MKLISIFLILFMHVSSANGEELQALDAYHIYNSDGERTDYASLFNTAEAADIVLFGELHNNPVTHWIRQTLVQDLAADTTRAFAVGLEMFESDQQIILDEFLSGMIMERSFEQQVRLWGNYTTDYRPMVRFLKEKEIPIIATNIPRRYANAVYHNGMEALENAGEKIGDWIAPMPITVDLTLPGYAGILEAAQGHGGDNLPISQAVKDATMAHFTMQYMRKNPESRFFHLHGTYHSNNYEGIYWYLRYYGAESEIMTVATVETDDLENFDPIEAPKADFLIVIPSSMIKTH